MNYHETAEKNIRGISITRDGERIFRLMITMDTHTDADPAKSEAVGLVYAHALLSGAKGYTRQQFQDALAHIGAEITIDFQARYLHITLTTTDTNHKKLLSLVQVMLQAPSFSAKEIKRIKELVANHLEDAKEDARLQSLRAFVNGLYAKHDRRFTVPTDTLIRTLADITPSDVARFHKEALAQKWIYTLVCDTSLRNACIQWCQKIRALFSEAKDAFTAPHIPKEIKKRELHLVSIPSRQNIELNIGADMPFPYASRDFYAFSFGLAVLGKWGGFAGRLMSTVREKEGLTYGIYAKTDTSSLSESGFWRIMTFFAPDKVEQGISSTLRQVELIVKYGITQDEYDRFKTILATGMALQNDSILSTAAQTHAYQIKGFTHETMQEHEKQILAVTKAEVDAALRKYLDPSKIVFAAAGPVLVKKKELQAFVRLAKRGE